ncbi:hypothetical protein HU200_066266 [Digitaria exilis]|uniref:VWFA domain-containing protein n=1 Tax=Digitaria exilis TaxID=1010633 RepID=A0A835A287_9POAL|nr:hypothetical protein HU200_066266 [Digitaria exilis]
MEYMKEAMMLVIRKLTPVDRLSIVTFSDVATRLCPLRCMTDAAQDDLVALVTGLKANGGPNIMAGLETGLSVIADRVNTKARIATVFLCPTGTKPQATPGRSTLARWSSTLRFGQGSGPPADDRHRREITVRLPGPTAPRWQLHDAEIDRRRPDDIRQVRVLHDGQLLLNRLQAELLKLTEGVVHIGSDTFLEQAKNFSKVPRRQRAPPMMTM